MFNHKGYKAKDRGTMMNISLRNRTDETVKIYFEKAKSPEIRTVLPQKAKTVEEALEDYRESLLPNAGSYGKTVFVDGNYIGDIWCYCIDVRNEPNAMISYCIFEKTYWSQGVATEAVMMFLREIQSKYKFRTVGAFTFSENIASIRVLEKSGFHAVEEFFEDGGKTKYFQYTY